MWKQLFSHPFEARRYTINGFSMDSALSIISSKGLKLAVDPFSCRRILDLS
jgi:hypothetical protein